MAKLNRRSFLRGAGAIAIGLPLMEEMAAPVARGQLESPTRLVTLFFGLGVHPDWQGDFTGPLEPLAPLASKMATFGVDLNRGAGGAHCETSATVFVGETPAAVDVAGGPSIDQWVRTQLDPSGATLASGYWWRRGACPAQALRVFQADGTPRAPIKRPSEVFDRLFGSYTPPSTDPVDPEVARERRIQRSVLDTVMDQYRYYAQANSPLGYRSRLKLEQHLNSIREIETRLAPMDEMMEMTGLTCAPPAAPSDPTLSNGSATYDYDVFTYGTGAGAPELDHQDVASLFRLHADLWVAALRCDRVQYGNLMFESAGGHTNLRGTYSALGESTSFPGTSQHDSYFHDNDMGQARLYQHFAMTNLAYFLEALDDPTFVEPNGGTVLDNCPVVVGTEYGWNHDTNRAFSAVVGGGGRYASGVFTDRRMNAIDLYNAVLTPFGIDARIGGRASLGEASVLLP